MPLLTGWVNVFHLKGRTCLIRWCEDAEGQMHAKGLEASLQDEACRGHGQSHLSLFGGFKD